MAQTPRLKYVLVARSGCGKTTMSGILEQKLKLRRCITSTTRPPRPGEVDGREYYFLKQFDPSKMFESTRFGNHWYGTTWDELNRSDFIILDPAGVAYYREHFPAPLIVIQLERSAIAVDENRMARDIAAGFDHVHPDLIVQGETIEEMSRNLIRAICSCDSDHRPPLDARILNAERQTHGSDHPTPDEKHGYKHTHIYTHV